MSADNYFSMTQTAVTITSPVTVDTTAGGTVIAAANDQRKEIILQNCGTTACIICCGETPTTSNYNFVLSAGSGARDGLGGSITIDFYQGVITGLTEASSTAIGVTEITN